MRTEYRVRVGVRERWTDAVNEADAMALADELDRYYRSYRMAHVKAVVQRRTVSDWRDVPRGKRRAR